MGCGCEKENTKIEIMSKVLNIDEEIIKRHDAGFDANRIAAQLLVSKDYVESILAPKPVEKKVKIKKSKSSE